MAGYGYKPAIKIVILGIVYYWLYSFHLLYNYIYISIQMIRFNKLLLLLHFTTKTIPSKCQKHTAKIC